MVPPVKDIPLTVDLQRLPVLSDYFFLAAFFGGLLFSGLLFDDFDRRWSTSIHPF